MNERLNDKLSCTMYAEIGDDMLLCNIGHRDHEGLHYDQAENISWKVGKPNELW